MRSKVKKLAKILTRLINITLIKVFAKKIDRVAFWVHTPEIINHFAPIWSEMGDVLFDVIFLEKSDISIFRNSANWNCRVVSCEDVLALRWRYECLVSNHAGYSAPDGLLFKGVHLFEIIAKENIRLQYAAGKIAWNLSDWNRVYDGIMCFGPFHEKIFSDKFSVAVSKIGYPRFDRYFNDDFDLSELREKYACDADKKTIVWLPTWTNISSIGFFEIEINELSLKYNIVVKIHPLMNEDEPEKIAYLKNLNFSKVIDDARDNIELYKIADYMLFDYGGPVFGAIYTGKKFIFLNVPGAEDHKHAGKHSPEILLREEFHSVNPDQNQISPALESDEVWKEHIATCDRVRDVYFAPNRGNSSPAAVRALLIREWLKE